MLGQNGWQAPATDSVTALTNPSVALAGIDAKRLLANSVSGHLEQVNVVLTQFVNSSESSDSEAEYATDMLVANRIYRQAATSQGKHQLAAFLAGLEPLLIEMAYAAQAGSPTSRERMQQEVRNGLLFRVRVMNKQLKKPETSA
jgi:type III secretory pathway lipoprotein EscJ